MNEIKGKGGYLIFAIIFAVLAIPAGIFSYTHYFAWDSQIEGKPYKLALEKDGKFFELNINGNSTAFDSGTTDDHFYLNSPYHLGDLIGIGFDDYQVEKTDNPFFAGKISLRNRQKYSEQEQKFLNAKDSVQVHKFFDQNRNLIFTYEPNIQSEFVVKLRPTFPAFSKRSYGIGTYKSEYINATKLLNEKLGKKLKIKTDEADELLILSFEK